MAYLPLRILGELMSKMNGVDLYHTPVISKLSYLKIIMIFL